jgi:hypothetical protein
MVHGEYPVPQVAEAYYGADDDYDSLSFNLWRSGVPHPAIAPTAPANVSHSTWNHYRKAYCTLGVSIFRGHPCVINRQLSRSHTELQ